ncbi:hypothetical protein [Nitrosococcus watsonii]|uniref:hypothetical protein n=1 Tax=Nitrosococcus watsonii TaxID=473531 RepID=UPI0002EDD0DC|nr:hypothetical protein [Nitrosococcus watsonii]
MTGSFFSSYKETATARLSGLGDLRRRQARPGALLNQIAPGKARNPSVRIALFGNLGDG